MATLTRRRRVPWGWLIGLLVLGGLGFAGFNWFKQRQAKAATPTVKVETASVSRGLFRVSVTGPGTLQAVNTLEVKPEVSGTVLQLPKVGDRVTKGQLMVRLNPDSSQRNLENAQLALQKAQTQLDGLKANQATSRATQNQNLESAQANFENAQRDAQTAATNLASTKRLFEVGGISQQGLNDAQNNHARAQNSLATAGVALNTARQNLGLKSTSDAQDLKNAQLAVQQAQISLKNAQADLSKTKIYAPFDGVVSVVSGTVGALSGQTALLTLVDDAKVEIPVQVDETEIGKIALGMPAEVSLDALGTEKFSGQVSRISPSAIIQQNIAVFYVTVTLDNPERTLRPGMTAEAEIIAEEVQGALLLPKRAVEQVRNRGYVMLQQPDGSSERVRVRVGPDDGTSIVIESGLEPGQTVVLPTRQRTGTGVTGGGQ